MTRLFFQMFLLEKQNQNLSTIFKVISGSVDPFSYLKLKFRRKYKMTNADRIRNMTDEELAEFMEPREFDCADYCNEFENGCAGACKHNLGKDFLLDWLQSSKN